MAQVAPKAIEIEEIQFKLQSKSNVFQKNDQLRSNINLLATASNYGLIFIGDPNLPVLKIVPIHGAVNTGGTVLAREIPLPSIPNYIAISCDGSMLAINYNLHNSTFLSIFIIQSFLTPNIQLLISNISLSAENNVYAVQLLWNPVITNMIAIILNNGALLMFNLKDTNYEFFSLDKADQAKCACWSPKGKQIVVGFPAGKLMQFKPDLKPARTILCPGNVHDGQFDTIAVQWLSTYQFAASFLQQGDDMQPCLYIINAPKVGNPVYINYYDICFSASGPRHGQIFLIYIQAWNLLLVASSNSMEMGVLGTTETGDLPTWSEYTMSDDSVRLALPMSIDKEETYPIGIALETGTLHQLTMNENQLPIMPMVHLLSTHGQLVSYDFLNLRPNTPGICSPPQLQTLQSGLSLFKPFVVIEQPKQQPEQITIQNDVPAQHDSSFMDNFGAATSTPAPKQKGVGFFGPGTPEITGPSIFGKTELKQPPTNTSNLFASNQNQTTLPFKGFGQPSTGNLFAGQVKPQPQPQLNQNSPLKLNDNELASSTPTPGLPFFSGKNNVPFNQTVQPNPTKMAPAVSNTKPINPEKSLPLYTVPPTFTPTATDKSAIQQKTESDIKVNFEDPTTLNVIQEMILTEINCFDLELNLLLKRSKSIDISIGNMDVSRQCTKRLNNLQEINDRAQDTYFEKDVQILLHSVNECFSMLEEAKSKLEMFENPEISILSTMSGYNQANLRQLAKLNSYIATNQYQLKTVQQQIDSNWSLYQDLVHQNSKTRMHIPSLEGVYLTLTKQKDILSTQRKKLAHIKSKLSIRDIINNKNFSEDGKSVIDSDSLVDSILSMSLSEHVKNDNSRLSDEKLQAIRDILKGRKINVVKPHRPERMNSEVILECNIRTERKRDGAVTKPEKMMFQSRIDQQPTNSQQQQQQNNLVLPKPAATKPPALKPVFNQPIKPEPAKAAEQNQTKPSLNFTGFASSFGVTNKQTTEPSKPQAVSLSKSESIKSFPSFSSESSIGASGSGTFSFSAKQPTTIGGGMFSGNTSEKSAFAVPPTFSGFSLGGGKNDNPTILPTFNPTSNNLFSVKTSVNEQTDSKSVFTSLAAPLPNTPFGKFELNSAPSLGKESVFEPLSENNQTVSISEATKATKSIEKSKTKDQTDDFLNNLNICKPTANQKISEIPAVTTENLFNVPSSKNPPFATDGNNDNVKSPFAGFGAVSTTANNNKSSVFQTDSQSTTDTKTTNDTSKPIFSGFGNTSTSTDTEKSIFSGFGGINLKTNEAAKPFTGFNIAQTGTDMPKPTDFSGFGTTTTTATTKSIFTGFSSTAAASNSNEVSKTPFAGFGAITSTAGETKSPFSAFGTITSTGNEAKLPFSGFGAITSPATETKSSFSGFGAITSNANETKSPFSGFGTTLSTANTETSKQDAVVPTDSASVSSSTTSSGSISVPTKPVTPPVTNTTFGALNLKTSTGLQFGNLSFDNQTSTSVAAPTTTQLPPTLTSVATPSFTQTITSETLPIQSPTSQPSIFSTANTSTVPVSGFGMGLSSETTIAPTPSLFGQTSPTSTTATLGFGSLTVTTTSGTSIFANAAAASTASFGTATMPTSIFGNVAVPTQMQGNIFGSVENSPAMNATSTGIFGGIPKPDQSVFAQTTPFGAQPNAVSGGSIFGGAANTNQSLNLFGQSASSFANASSGGSIFGGQKPESNIFGSVPNQPAQQLTGSSIFSQQSPTFVDQSQQNQSIFGSPQSGASSGFGGGSIFGGNNTPQNSGFGNSGPFSSGAPTGGAFSSFGTPVQQTSPGAFAQGGLSVAQTGFGSPNSPFSKPAGGFGAPAFGGSPSFGGSPAFGGPATFGGFGTAQPGGSPVSTSFASPTQKNNLFETLGSSGDGVSFGNLAQNVNQNAANQTFASGSSFSSWR